MNQQQLIDDILIHTNKTYERSLNKTDIRATLDALAAVVMGEMQVEGGEVTLPGLGKLKADVRGARTGRNPATGAAIEIPAKNTVKFAAAKALKDALA